jgi:hypothetical protein
MSLLRNRSLGALLVAEVVSLTVVAQGFAFVQAATQLTQLGGPILGGLLIAWISAPGVLLIDACTYAFSFAVVLLFVRAGKRVAPDETARGLFAGIRYLARDRLLGPTLALTNTRGDGEEEADAIPATDLAPVAPVEARAHPTPS